MDVQVVRDVCGSAVDAGLLEHEPRSHEYEPAVTLVQADGMDDLALAYLEDIVAEERDEPVDEDGTRMQTVFGDG